MQTESRFAIVAAQDGGMIRLGWVSAVTGITYCGVCLRSPLEPSVGALCESCGACVVGTFGTKDDAHTVRSTWKQAGCALHRDAAVKRAYPAAAAVPKTADAIHCVAC